MSASKQAETSEQIPVGALSTSHGNAAPLCHNEKAFRAAAPLGRGITHPRMHEPLFFHAIKRGTNSTRRRFASGTRCDLTTDRHAIGIFVEAQNRQEDNLFELT
jgi:hypothetical protein